MREGSYCMAEKKNLGTLATKFISDWSCIKQAEQLVGVHTDDKLSCPILYVSTNGDIGWFSHLFICTCSC